MIYEDGDAYEGIGTIFLLTLIINKQCTICLEHFSLSLYVKHALTHDQGCFWELQYPQENKNEFVDVFHAHQHFFYVHLPPFHLP